MRIKIGNAGINTVSKFRFTPIVLFLRWLNMLRTAITRHFFRGQDGYHG